MDQKNSKNSNGNNHLLEKFLEGDGDRLRYFIFGMVKDHHHTEDIFQDTLVNILKYQDSFRGNSKFSTWIHKIAIRATACYMGKRKVKREGHEKYFVEGKILSQPNKNPEEIFMELKQKEITQKIYDDERNKVVVLQSQGYSEKEIAEELGIKIGTVKSRSFYVRKRLENEIGRESLNLLQ